MLPDSSQKALLNQVIFNYLSNIYFNSLVYFLTYSNDTGAKFNFEMKNHRFKCKNICAFSKGLLLIGRYKDEVEIPEEVFYIIHQTQILNVKIYSML